MEIKRLLNRKVLIAGALLILLQALLFVTVQLDGAGWQEWTNANRAYNRRMEEAEELTIEELISLYEERIWVQDADTRLDQKILSKLKYLASYHDSIQEILDRAGRVISFSIFQTDEYTAKNIEKTRQDFAALLELEPGWERDRVTEQVLKFPYLSFFVMALLLYVLYETVKERENGVWELTHTMRYGRGRLAWQRGLCLILFGIAFYGILYGIDIGLACLFYGADDFSGPIQTVRSCAKYTALLSRGQYLLLVFVQNGLAIAAPVMFAYLVFLWMNSRNLAAVAVIAVYGAEWKLYQIPVQSKWSFWHYVNLFGLFDVSALDREYHNLKLFGTPVASALAVKAVAAAVLLLCLGAAVFCYEKKYRRQGSTMLARLIAPVRRRLRRLFAGMSVNGKELYKLLISGRNWMVLAAGLALCLTVWNRTEVTIPLLLQEMDEQYLKYGGADWDRFDRFVEEQAELYNDYLRQEAEASAQIESGVDVEQAISQLMLISRKKNVLLTCLEEYQELQMQRMETEWKSGVTPYAMSDRGYDEVMGKNSILREAVTGIVALLVSVLVASRVFGMERQAGMKPVIRCSGKGIRWLCRRKLGCCMAVTLGVILLYWGTEWGMLVARYDLPYPEAPVQSVTFLSAETVSMSLWQYLLLLYWFRLQAVFAAAGAVLFISSHRQVKNQMYIPMLIVGFGLLYLAATLYTAGTWKGATVFLMICAVLLPLLNGIAVVRAGKIWCG